MGTTVQHIAGRGSQPEAAHSQPGPGQPFFNQRGGNWQQQPQHSIKSQSPEANFSTPAQNGPGLFGQQQGQVSAFDGSGAAHQAGRGTSQMPNNPASGNPPPRSVHTPTPTAAQGALNGSAAQQANLERRGPVEFNHAISYVNKIKVR
jgi:paired amphipathic helix protein Sin3a